MPPVPVRGHDADAGNSAIDEGSAAVLYEDWEFFGRLSRRHLAAFADVETAINRGHAGDRLTHRGLLEKAQTYFMLIERVWRSDPDFCAQHEVDVRRAEGHALLAVARGALLASKREVAQAALAQWDGLATPDRHAEARLLSWCARAPAGRTVLRSLQRGRTALRLLTGHLRHPANPAA